MNFPKEATCVQVFGPGLNLLPNTLSRVVFANETTVFQDLVLKKRRRLSEDDQINILPELAGQIRLNPQPLTAGDYFFCDDRQIEITAPAIPAGCC
jgi:hypothetical protein